ncbi:MAG: tRNA (N6-isopentenyl adenosine(37)-C2)-methylthiotransferase MiaB [Firmicutes bacterium]|nr:tRNA (N6-isopentenyl adenosine(37)-C2)-methylthiotransferase MiaB [Bacillota bacterium]
MMQKKYYITTYGCQMNVHESEKLAGILRDRGFVHCESDAEADVLVFNTCCIRENAENRVVGNLGFAKGLKAAKPNMKIAVCGCMPQQDGAAQRIKERCPFVDLIFGTHNLHKFGEYLDTVEEGEDVLEVWNIEGKTPVEGLPIERKGAISAWVNIMYGCDNYCSYCIVPYVRGREKNRDPDLILADVKQLVKEGYKEITLLGQNVNSYKGERKDGKIVDFAKLLECAAKIEGEFWIRFMTSHPKDFSDSVIKVIAENQKISRFLHLPAQAGSDRILSLMNRKYTKKQYLDMVEKIKKAIPDAVMSGDIMVGFPTETEEDFLETMDLVKKVQYNNLFTFIYSKRKGTKAHDMDGQVDKGIKRDRITKLIAAQADNAKNLAQKDIGKQFIVLCDAYHEKSKLYSGKTLNGKQVSFKASTNFIGQFVAIKITNSKNSNLIGEMV